MLTRISNSSLDLVAIPKFESFLPKKSQFSPQFSLRILYTSWREGQFTFEFSAPTRIIGTFVRRKFFSAEFLSDYYLRTICVLPGFTMFF